MHHYYIENENLAGISAEVFKIAFNDADKKHVRAQRLDKAEHITVVDKTTNYFELEVVSSNSDDVEARIARRIDFPKMRFKLTLFQGVSKNAKLDDVLRGATEIGIDEFFAVNMERSVAIIKNSAANKKIERFELVARSASMQSGRPNLPKAGVLSSFDELISYLDNIDLLVVFWERASVDDSIEIALGNLEGVSSVGILIGPEGGISDSEIEKLKECPQTKICTLGDTILRTETAGIVAPAIVKHVLEKEG